MLNFDIKNYFTAARIAKRFEVMPPWQSSIMDLLYPESVRDQYELAVVPVSEITQTVQVVPVVQRGSASIPMPGQSTSIDYIEPLPVRLHAQISATDLNNLKLLGESSREKWAARRQEQARRTVRITTEVLCAQAVLGGKVSFPLLQSNGQYQTYEVSYQGQDILSRAVAAASKWDSVDCTLVKIYELLEQMASDLDAAGYGGDRVTLAGATAYSALLALIEGTDKPKIAVTVGKGQVDLGGHSIRKMAEAYRNPQTGASAKKLADNEIRMVTKGYTGLIYAAVDDLDANLQAMPMFVKPVKIEDPSGYRLVTESKPLPCVAPKATCKAIVTA